jgi:hypothetical protein
MKNVLTCVCGVALLLGSFGCGGCIDFSAKDAAKSVTESTVGTLKDVGAGVNEGFDEGRKGTVGPDGALIITTKDEVAKYLELAILSAKPISTEADGVDIVLSVTNKYDQPIRMANLMRKGSLVLLDKDGFATHLQDSSSNEDSITVLPGLKEKFTYRFNGKADEIVTIKIYGHDYELPEKAHDSAHDHSDSDHEDSSH